MNNQATYINSEVADNNLTETLSENNTFPIEFNNYRSILFNAFIDTLQKCYSQIQSIQSNQTEKISTFKEVLFIFSILYSCILFQSYKL